MPIRSVSYNFAFDHLVTRVLLANEGRVKSNDLDKTRIVTIPGGDKVHIVLAGTQPTAQMIDSHDKPISGPIPLNDAAGIVSLLHNVDASIIAARPELPKAFFDLADRTAEFIEEGRLIVVEPIGRLSDGTLGHSGFRWHLPQYRLEIEDELARFDQEMESRDAPPFKVSDSLIRWYGWLDARERAAEGIPSKTWEIDGYYWKQAQTDSAGIVLRERASGLRMGVLRGDIRLEAFFRYAPDEDAAVYYLENAEGGLEAIARKSELTDDVTIIGRPHWQNHQETLDRLTDYLEADFAYPAIAP